MHKLAELLAIMATEPTGACSSVSTVSGSSFSQWTWPGMESACTWLAEPPLA
jgi:hypothetical protein